MPSNEEFWKCEVCAFMNPTNRQQCKLCGNIAHKDNAPQNEAADDVMVLSAKNLTSFDKTNIIH